MSKSAGHLPRRDLHELRCTFSRCIFVFEILPIIAAHIWAQRDVRKAELIDKGACRAGEGGQQELVATNRRPVGDDLHLIISGRPLSETERSRPARGRFSSSSMVLFHGDANSFCHSGVSTSVCSTVRLLRHVPHLPTDEMGLGL